MSRITFIVALIALVLLSSCSQRENRNLGIKFVDDANLYSEGFRDSILAGKFRFPNGIPVLIKTVDSIPVNLIGSFATAELEKDSNWLSWESKRARKNCLLILVSRQPRLIQIRFGKRLSLETYRAGLSLGVKYRQMQEIFISKGFEDGLQEVLSRLEKELPPALKLPWLLRMERPGAQLVFNELSDLTMPSDNAYTTFIFKPYSKLTTSLSIFSHPIVLVIFNALLLLLLVKAGQALINKVFRPGRLRMVTIIIWNISSSIFFAIPFWGSIIFLSSFRMEDALFADYLRIPLPALTAYSGWFSSFTPIWISILIGLLVFAVDFGAFYLAAININYLMHTKKEDIQRGVDDNTSEILEQAAGQAFRYAIFSLFMPRAISLLLLFYYILKIPSAISRYVKLNKLNI